MTHATVSGASPVCTATRLDIAAISIHQDPPAQFFEPLGCAISLALPSKTMRGRTDRQFQIQPFVNGGALVARYPAGKRTTV
jgi:hypothetical protein